jgi:hypothetical protein
MYAKRRTYAKRLRKLKSFSFSDVLQQIIAQNIYLAKMTELKPEIQFTRYLYEKSQVELCLEWSMWDGVRDEALFWAYELYHSGFQAEVWDLVKSLYAWFYAETSPKFGAVIEKTWVEWKQTGDACSLGTIVGTLAAWRAESIQAGKRKFIIICREDRHQTAPIDGPKYRYLEKVSKYSIQDRMNGVLGEGESDIDAADLREAYLGGDWLYYCRNTPIWAERIAKYGGICREDAKTVAFKSDDDLEAFYEAWGFEPDEQSREMHLKHGVIIV